MFVQVIKGRTNDPAGLRSHADRWTAEVRPGAIGHLGGTFGIAADGTFVVLARFEDEAKAAANAERPEQRAWYEALLPLLDGAPTFRESTDVDTLFDGPSSAATFVQVMEGTAADRAKVEAMEAPELLERLRTARPDLLGSLRAWFDGGAFVEAAYFTSEAEARAGEASTDFAEEQQEFAAAFGDLTYIDLPDPQHS